MKQAVMNTNITTEAYLRGNKKPAVDYIGSLVTFFFLFFCNDKQAGCRRRECRELRTIHSVLWN